MAVGGFSTNRGFVLLVFPSICRTEAWGKHGVAGVRPGSRMGPVLMVTLEDAFSIYGGFDDCLPGWLGEE